MTYPIIGLRIMSGEALRKARQQRGWTQAEAGVRLGVSQAYVALLEKERRRVPTKLARKAVRLWGLDPVLLPPAENPSTLTPATAKSALAGSPDVSDQLARDLSRLGYPGFAYLRGGWLKNPGEVLLTALAQRNLDSRVAEALPWLLLRYPEMDSDWLVTQTRLLNLANRLGFVVDLARHVLERKNETDSARYQTLTRLSNALRSSRLDVEDTFGQESLTETERNWLRANRPDEARFWHLLTNWQPEFLQYAL
jgi:transcriptional regulator with XRE-family HTH domain